MIKKKFNKLPIYLNFRTQGIYEQYKRAKRFLKLASRCQKPTSRFRNLIAAIYPARAIVELMFEAAKTQELKEIRSDKKLRKKIRPLLPYYDLVYRIRIHDFHRFGCLPPQKKFVQSVGGPIVFRLQEQGDIASMSLKPEGISYIHTGESSIELNKPLDHRNDTFFDDDSGKYIPLDRILNDYLDAIPGVIEYFIKNLK